MLNHGLEQNSASLCSLRRQLGTVHHLIGHTRRVRVCNVRRRGQGRAAAAWLQRHARGIVEQYPSAAISLEDRRDRRLQLQPCQGQPLTNFPASDPVGFNL